MSSRDLPSFKLDFLAVSGELTKKFNTLFAVATDNEKLIKTGYTKDYLQNELKPHDKSSFHDVNHISILDGLKFKSHGKIVEYLEHLGDKIEITKPLVQKEQVFIEVIQTSVKQEPQPPFIGPIRLYNAVQPYVLVDTASDDPARGDSHGHIGLAKRVAEKIGARYEVIDRGTLVELYPDLQGTDDYVMRQKRLQRYFEEHGYPDFYFSREANSVMPMLNAQGSGMVVEDINECLPEKLLAGGTYPSSLVPHHLTPEILAEQGRIFAEEYAELPRPLIGVVVTDAYLERVAQQLAGFRHAYPEATFFICSSRRTERGRLSRFLKKMEAELKGAEDRFPLVVFDYLAHAENYAKEDYWNPYQGLLDQADHLVETGRSSSVISEMLSTGKTVHMYSPVYDKTAKQFLSNIFEYSAGMPLVTRRVDLPDLTSACADALIQKHFEHKSDTCRPVEITRTGGPVRRVRYNKI